MHPGQVIALAVVLDRQLPVRLHIEVHGPADLAAVAHQVEVVGPPPLRQRRDEVREGRRVLGQVDEHQVGPDRAAHPPQAVPAPIERGVVVDVLPAEVRRRGQRAGLQLVAEGVVGAAQAALHPLRLADQLHAAVAANVVVDLHRALVVADHHQRHAQHVHRLRIALARQGGRRADAGPGAREEHRRLIVQEVRIDVGLVGQAARRLDRLLHRGQGLVRNDRSSRNPVLHGASLPRRRNSKVVHPHCALRLTFCEGQESSCND